MNKREIIYLRWIFESRDMLAKELNLPPYRVMDKRLIVNLAKNPIFDKQELRRKISHSNKKFENSLLTLSLVGLEGARKEIEEKASQGVIDKMEVINFANHH